MEPDALPYRHPKQIVKNSWRKAFLIKQTNKIEVEGLVEFVYL